MGLRIKNTTNNTKSTKYDIFFLHLGFGPIGPLCLEFRPQNPFEIMGNERPLTERRIPEERRRHPHRFEGLKTSILRNISFRCVTQ